MLTDEEKQRIRQEEIFRQEVRETLGQDKKAVSFQAKLWKFVNTTFGIWLLSTVAVGLITWSFTSWNENKEKERITKESIRKLDVEIFVRVNNFSKLLESINKLKQFMLAIDTLDRSDLILSAGVFPEYKERTLGSLLLELQSLVPEEEKANIALAFDGARQISEFNREYLPALNSNNNPEDMPIPKEKLDIAKSLLQKHLMLKRWEKL